MKNEPTISKPELIELANFIKNGSLSEGANGDNPKDVVKRNFQYFITSTLPKELKKNHNYASSQIKKQIRKTTRTSTKKKKDDLTATICLLFAFETQQKYKTNGLHFTKSNSNSDNQRLFSDYYEFLISLQNYKNKNIASIVSKLKIKEFYKYYIEFTFAAFNNKIPNYTADWKKLEKTITNDNSEYELLNLLISLNHKNINIVKTLNNYFASRGKIDTYGFHLDQVVRLDKSLDKPIPDELHDLFEPIGIRTKAKPITLVNPNNKKVSTLSKVKNTDSFVLIVTTITIFNASIVKN